MASDAATRNAIEVDVEGHRLALTNLEKVLYPSSGFTKGDLIDYYRRVAPVLLPFLAGRPVTFRRFPEGVAAPSFYEKHLPRGAPPWVPTVTVPSRSKGGKVDEYPAVGDLASLVWAANLAAIELHVPMWRKGAGGRPSPPDLLVLDLDPGAPAGLADCCRVACALRARLEEDGYHPLAKSSGSKGLQLYARRPPGRRGEDPSAYARSLAEQLAAEPSARVVANMRRDLRSGRVLVDWSQNSTAKTTVAPYSLRARETPGVSAPLQWSEVEAIAAGDGPRPLEWTPAEVLARVEHLGDLFAPLLEGD